MSFGRKINTWLAEPKGEVFRHGKWRFWFPTLVGLTALNAVMTAVIFGQDGAQKYIGSIVVMAGAVLCWLALGLLHYSDSEDRTLAIGVASLDSITLLFVAVHFSFLLWCQGHLWNLRAAETKYQGEVAEYNAQAAKLSTDNNDLARTAERIAEIEKQTERLRNDTAYWSKKNGVKLRASGVQFQLSTAKVELPLAPTPPPEASASFLARWDWWIRVAGFGELALSIVTLIFVRTRTAVLNARRQAEEGFENFPDELDADVVQDHRSGRRLTQTRKSDSAPLSCAVAPETFDRKRARRKLLEHLKVISHYHPGRWFKADLIEGGILIRMSKRINGVEETIAETRQSDKLLAAVDRPDFQERLLDELIRRGFPIEKDKMSL
jgi:hypothetical protein